MECSNCGNETHGGYCDCMIINGEFKGDWWNMKVKFTGGYDFYHGLTTDKIYDVIREFGKFYVIKNSYGEETSYPKGLFENVKE